MCFMSCPDMTSAGVIAEYLRVRECPAIAFPIPPTFELGPTAEVRVPSQFLHRARWFWSLADAEELTEGEIEYLATGKLPGSVPEPVPHDDAA
jgi:hypothetical protein